VYLDDIFVYSRSVQEHQRHLELLFSWLCKHEFYLKQEKCELFMDKVECLGHMIDKKGLHMVIVLNQETLPKHTKGEMIGITQGQRKGARWFCKL
jgi:AAA+ ATPase superfamily predicted ATPase